MIKIFIGLSSVLAVIMIVMGGIEYMTSELVSSKEAGRSKITNAVLGLLLALGAWAILYTINPGLLSTKVVIDQAVVDIPFVPEAPPPPCLSTPGGCGGYNKTDDWAVKAGPQTIIPEMTNGWITINNQSVANYPECKKVGDQGCTSLRGLNASALQNTQWGCACNLNVTGGTESWLHSADTSHHPGSVTIDLGMNEKLDAYIKTKGTKCTDSVSNKQIYKIGNIGYLREGPGGVSTGNHWHVYATTGTCN